MKRLINHCVYLFLNEGHWVFTGLSPRSRTTILEPVTYVTCFMLNFSTFIKAAIGQDSHMHRGPMYLLFWGKALKWL